MGFFFPRSDIVTKPNARTGVMAYGPNQGAFIMFGGQGATNQLNDTWEFNGVLWEQKSPALVPNKRRGHAMSTGITVDGITYPGIVMVGGYYNDGADNYLIDVHEWNGTNWVAITMDGTEPNPREHHSLIYDPVNYRYIMTGGRNDSKAYDDTVVITASEIPTQLHWAALTVGSNFTTRYGHAMAYDQVNQKVIMFGGMTFASAYLGDTYILNGSDWDVQSPGTSPSARAFHRMTWDPVLQRVVLWGGVNGGGKLQDAYTWTGSDWEALTLTGTKPSARSDFAMDLNTDAGMIFLFGGDGSLLQDTWGFVPGAVDANGLNVPLPLYPADAAITFKADCGYFVPPQ